MSQQPLPLAIGNTMKNKMNVNPNGLAAGFLIGETSAGFKIIGGGRFVQSPERWRADFLAATRDPRYDSVRIVQEVECPAATSTE